MATEKSPSTPSFSLWYRRSPDSYRRYHVRVVAVANQNCPHWRLLRDGLVCLFGSHPPSHPVFAAMSASTSESAQELAVRFLDAGNSSDAAGAAPSSSPIPKQLAAMITSRQAHLLEVVKASAGHLTSEDDKKRGRGVYRGLKHQAGAAAAALVRPSLRAAVARREKAHA